MGLELVEANHPRSSNILNCYRPMIDVDAQKDHTTIGLATLEEWM
jgi:hypothetical protein